VAGQPFAKHHISGRGLDLRQLFEAYWISGPGSLRNIGRVKNIDMHAVPVAAAF
jgi:hypothetical protein